MNLEGSRIGERFYLGDGDGASDGTVEEHAVA